MFYKNYYLLFKKTIILLILIFLIIIIYFNFIKAVAYENTYDAIIYSVNGDFEKRTSIILEGKIHKNGVKEDIFIGTVTVDNDIIHNIKMKDYTGLISSTDDYGYTISIGSIQTSSDLSMIWLSLKEIDDRYNLKCYLSGPANNREEGYKIAENILEE